MRRQDFYDNEALLSPRGIQSISTTEYLNCHKPGAGMALDLEMTPVIASFREMVPESHFEFALRRILEFGCIGKSMQKANPRYLVRKMCLFPFSFDHLVSFSNFPLDQDVVSMIRKENNQSINHTCVNANIRIRRSTAFLRYFIARKDTDVDISEDYCTGQYSILQQHLKSGLVRQVGGECEVDMLPAGSYINALYTGMWLYQCKRLDSLIQRIANGNSRKHLVAKISIAAELDHFELRLGFFSGAKPIEVRDYLLRTRPHENLSRCVERLIIRIANYGIQVIIGGDLHTTESRSEKNNGFFENCPRVAVPI